MVQSRARQFADVEGVVLANHVVAKGYHLLSLRLSDPMPPARPGQFVMIRVPSPDVFLRRPFSIYEYKRGVLSVLYKVTGKGTNCLSQSLPGAKTMVLGPLGNGFTVMPRHQAVIVAGGIGLAGIRLLCSKLKGKASLFWGCAGKSEIGLIEGLRTDEGYVATVDGSVGCKGNVIELLAQELPRIRRPLQVFACGPEGMFRSLKGLLRNEQLSCQVLLEERMACGIGICFGCVCKTNDTDEPYKRVCKEGPVFDLWQTSL
jgi:dihydroorotate dehydrogenase electron transfer subunit